MRYRKSFFPLLMAITIGLASRPAISREDKGMMEGRKALFIIAHQNFRDEEFTHPKAVLEKQGVKVTVASSSRQKAAGMLGMTVQPDILLPEVKVGDYDLVVFVGGSGSDEYWEDAEAHRIAETAFQEGKIVAAICIAPVTLAKAGLLKGRKATVFSSCVDHLKEKGAIYTAQPVVQDGRIITASGPDAANSFGRRLLEALKDQ